MSDIEKRIAAILGSHWLEDYARDAAPGYDCSCGQSYGGLDDFNAHVAAVLVAELGLTQELEKRKVIDGGTESTGNTRYVTPWGGGF